MSRSFPWPTLESAGGVAEDPKSVARSLDLLQRAQAFHQPTRAFYFVRAECRRRQGNTAAADEDEKQFKAATARTAWDYYPARTHGRLARRSRRGHPLVPGGTRACSRTITTPCSFSRMRLSTDKINRPAEAVAYFTGCIALRPDHIYAYVNRGRAHRRLGRLDAAEADYTAAVAAAANDLDRADAYGLRQQFFEGLGAPRRPGGIGTRESTC